MPQPTLSNNPLSTSHRDGLAMALAEWPEKYDWALRAESIGVDLGERKQRLQELKAAMEGILDQFFDGYRLKT